MENTLKGQFGMPGTGLETGTEVVFNLGRAPFSGPGPSRKPMEYHRRLPGYEPTPLVDCQRLASGLGLGKVWVKVESQRLGLPSFKALGASWAVNQRLMEMGVLFPQGPRALEAWRKSLRRRGSLTLATATDGNHGRAVAWMAKLLALKARIFVPIGTAASRIQAIQGEGAEVIVVDGTYDEAVRRAAQEESENCLVISDTSWPGYEKVTSWVVEGYSTLFWEVEDDLARRGEKGPDLVFVQVGVGSLAAAAVRHYRRKDVKDSPFIVSVEPQTAACALASIKAGGRVSVPGPHRSIMAGLNCGEPSLVAWPILKDGVDMFMAIDDGRAMAAMRDLASEGIVSGETGAAGLGGLKELLAGPYSGQARKRLDIGQHTRVLLISTEGATNPDFYRQVVGG